MKIGVALFLLGMSCAQNLLAHSRWLVPSHTNLSSAEPEWVSFDFSISNGIFHADNAYGGIALYSLSEDEKLRPEDKKSPFSSIMASTRLKVNKPDGTVFSAAPLVNLGRKSSSAYEFEDSGTYAISVTQDPIYFVTYADVGGERKRTFGAWDKINKGIPSDAKELVEYEIINLVQTFVTRKKINMKAVAPKGKNLELEFITHPNDLFVGEKMQARVLLHGETVPTGTSVSVIRGGTRFRNDREEHKYITNEKGEVSISWPEAGMYLVEAELSIPKEASSSAVDIEYLTRYGFYITLEVSPQ